MPQGFLFQNQSALIFTSQKGLFTQSANLTKFSHMWVEDDYIPEVSPSLNIKMFNQVQKLDK